MSAANSHAKSAASFESILDKSSPVSKDDQENAKVLAFSDKDPHEVTVDEQPGLSKRHRSPARPSPSTPATRLPLADLLGENDENRNAKSVAQVSPEDHIGWLPSKSPHSSYSKTSPTSRGQKRARSSSPASASQKSAVKRANQKAALDLEEMKQALRTPQTDPATSLWNRYSVGVSKDTPLGRQLASITGGQLPSSPYNTEEQAGNVGGLRRWTSCGIEFPTSKRKRRRIYPMTESNQVAELFDEMMTNNNTNSRDQAKTSRIGSLLDKISESLERSRSTKDEERSKAPSSSSPLPDRHDGFDRQSISPIRAPDLADGKTFHALTMAANPQSPMDNQDSKQQPSSSSSTGTLLAPAVEQADDAITRNTLTGDLRQEEQQPPGARDPASIISLNVDDFDDDFDFSEEDLEDTLDACRPENMPTLTQVGDLQEPSRLSNIKENELGDGDGGDGDDDDDDYDVDEELFAAAEASATQSHPTVGRLISSRRNNYAIQRYLVKDVFEGDYVNGKGYKEFEKVLSVEDERTGIPKAITLRESWFDTRCSKGSYVHVIGEFNDMGDCLIDDTQNMLILHPDHLMSALAVADSFSCMRKAVLQDRIKVTSESTPPMLYGTMLHEIFQESMKENRWDEDWLRETIGCIVARHIEDLYQTHLNMAQAVNHLEGKIPELQAWARVFVKAKDEGMGMIKDRNGKFLKMSVNKLLDVEEHIWSPMYGLKGNIDATIEVSMGTDEGDEIGTFTVPLELKTGKRENPSHRAQTALYTLLLSDRYDVAVAYGILYYIETSQTMRISAIRHELRHMIMQRNELACYVRERLTLPPMLRNTHTCNNCYAKQPCFVYHKLVEDGTGETSGLRDKFDALTQHLNPIHKEFFQKWDDLLTKEESEMMKFRRELWTMLSSEREKLGRCYGNVSLVETSFRAGVGASKINRFTYDFRKQTDLSDFSFTESQIAIGDPIVISDERGHYALAKGYVIHMTRSQVTVAVDRRLHNARVRQAGFDEVANQVFVGITDSYAPMTSVSTHTSTSASSPLYRIDKDEFSNGMSLIRNNLIQIMSHDTFGAAKIRSLVADGCAPNYKSACTDFTIAGPASQASINDDQRAAVEKILSAEDYALVLGMPGTGKTTTIAHIIRALVAKGKSVLLTSYTHSAVDNILLKLRADDISLLRLGVLAKIHPDVREFAHLACEPRGTIDELERLYHEPQVVATTCLGISHAIFNERVFDVCIVDEASQITLPVCLGPIRLARSFVLVGDHFQLSPLVQNRDALKGGLDVSLFRTLCEAHPEAVSTLGVQYRMNEGVMSLANGLIYNGRLRCGSDAVAGRSLALPAWEKIARLHVQHYSQLQRGDASLCRAPTDECCWLISALKPTSPSVVFLNTDAVLPGNQETNSGARLTNTLEADLVSHLVDVLILTGVSPSAIGVMTLYRSQLALIKAHLSQPHSTGSQISSGLAIHVEAHTADRFQGRDKEVVIMSCVRSNERNSVGDLLRDWRRVNVALTRARSKLVIVGSKKTLSYGDELLKKMVSMCHVIDVPANGWTHDLADAGKCVSTEPQKKPATPKQDENTTSKPRKPLGRKTASDINADRRPNSSKLTQAQLLKPGQKPFKVPGRVGKVMSSNSLANRRTGPVLENVMKEILGDESDW